MTEPDRRDLDRQARRRLRRGDAQGGAAPPPRRLAPGRHRARAGADPRRRRAARLAGHVRAPSSRRCRAPTQAELLQAFDLPIALMQDAEALAPDHGRARRDQGGRQRPLRRDPLGAAAPRRSAACRSPRGSRRSAPARARPRRGPASTVRLICTALRSHDPERNVELAETAARFRDQGLTGWDLAGPEEALPGPARPRPGVRGGAGRRPAHHGPRRRVGRRGPGPSRARRRARADRPRVAARSTTRRSCAELAARGIALDLCPTSNWQAGIVPVARRPSARPAASGRRAGHAQHGRHDRVRHHAVGGVRQRRRADRADAAGAVGHRPPRARRRVRRRRRRSRRCGPRSTPGRPGSRSCASRASRPPVDWSPTPPAAARVSALPLTDRSTREPVAEDADDVAVLGGQVGRALGLVHGRCPWPRSRAPASIQRPVKVRQPVDPAKVPSVRISSVAGSPCDRRRRVRLRSARRGSRSGRRCRLTAGGGERARTAAQRRVRTG